jgi:hypothetical protein
MIHKRCAAKPATPKIIAKSKIARMRNMDRSYPKSLAQTQLMPSTGPEWAGERREAIW